MSLPPDDDRGVRNSLRPLISLIGAGLAITVAALIVALASSMAWPLTGDAALLHYLAWLISQGFAPYRDFLDMNLPGTYFIHLAAVEIFGRGDLAWRLFDLGWLCLACGAAAALAWRYGIVAVVLGTSFVGLYHLSQGAADMGQREYLIAVLLLWAVWALDRFHARGFRRWLILAGALVGVAVSVKATAALFFVQCAALLAYFGARGWRDMLRRWLDFGVGFAVLPTLCALYLYLAGAFPAFVDDYAPYIRVYARVGAADVSDMIANFLIWNLPLTPLLAFAGIFLVIVRWRGRMDFTQHALLQGAVFGVAVFVVQGKGWQYHLYPFFFFAAVFSAICAGLLITGAAAALRRAVLALFAISTLVAAPWLAAAAIGDRHPREMQTRMQDDLRAIVAQRGSMQIQVLDTTWGGVEALYRLGIVQPTPFIYDWQFFAPIAAPIAVRFKQRFLTQLAASPPGAFVITAESWPLEKQGYERIDAWNEFAGFLAARYVLAVERAGYRIYVADPPDHR